MNQIELRRAREVPELLRDAFSIYRRHLWVFLALAAAVVVPVDLIVSGVGLEQLSGGYNDDPSVAETALPTVVSFLVTTPLITAACVYALEAVAAGERPPVGETLTRGLEAFTPVFVAVLVAALGIALGLLALILPGIYLAVRWFFVPQAVVLDGRRSMEALRRSGEVVTGFWWRTLGIVVLGNLLAFLPSLLVVPPVLSLAKSADSEAISLAGQALIETLTVPFLALLATLLWFDLQARRKPSGV